MFEVIQTKVSKSEKSASSPLFLSSSGKKMGFYEFILSLIAVSWYFFFTGMAIARGRKNFPKKWFDIGVAVGAEKIIKKAVEKPVVKNNITVKDISKKDPPKDMVDYKSIQ